MRMATPLTSNGAATRAVVAVAAKALVFRPECLLSGMVEELSDDEKCRSL